MTRGLAVYDEDDERPGPRFVLEPISTITYSEAPLWAVKGLLGSTGLAVIFGPPKSYKSFVALDVALHITEGRPWAGRRTKRGAVVYVCAEGVPGFRNRIAANRERRPELNRAPFFLVAGKPNLGAGQGDVADLIAAIEPYVSEVGPLAAIFVDTLVRTLHGASENDDGMRNFVDNAERVADHFGCVAVAVHHTGKDAARGMRGSSSLHGAAVTTWKVERAKRFEARITLEDAKDGESGLTWTATLDPHIIGRDEDGDDKTVLLVADVTEPQEVDEAGEREAKRTSPRAAPRQKIPTQMVVLIDSLDAALKSAGTKPPVDLKGRAQRVVSQAAVREAYGAHRGDDATDDAKRKAFDYALNKAVERGLIGIAPDEANAGKILWRTAA